MPHYISHIQAFKKTEVEQNIWSNPSSINKITILKLVQFENWSTIRRLLLLLTSMLFSVAACWIVPMFGASTPFLLNICQSELWGGTGIYLTILIEITWVFNLASGLTQKTDLLLFNLSQIKDPVPRLLLYI